MQYSPGLSFLVMIEYCTSAASWIIDSISCCDFFPFLESSRNSLSMVYSPRKKALTFSSLIGKRAFTDFSPVQSSRWVLRSTKICTKFRNVQKHEETSLPVFDPYPHTSGDEWLQHLRSSQVGQGIALSLRYQDKWTWSLHANRLRKLF